MSGIVAAAAAIAQQQLATQQALTPTSGTSYNLGSTATIWSGTTISNSSGVWNYDATVNFSDETIDKLFENPRFISNLKKYIFNQELKEIVNGNE